MVGRRTSLEALSGELQEVAALISAHPLASQRIRAAHQVVDEKKSEGPVAVDRELAASGLPGAVELGAAHVAGTWSWWKLRRRRRKLQRQIERRRRR